MVKQCRYVDMLVTIIRSCIGLKQHVDTVMFTYNGGNTRESIYQVQGNDVHYYYTQLSQISQTTVSRFS